VVIKLRLPDNDIAIGMLHYHEPEHLSAKLPPLLSTPYLAPICQCHCHIIATGENAQSMRYCYFVTSRECSVCNILLYRAMLDMFKKKDYSVSSVSNIRDIKFSLKFCLSASKNPIRKFNSSIEQCTKSQRSIMILQDMYSDKQHFTAQGTPYSVAT
jgi:hypothetical protein